VLDDLRREAMASVAEQAPADTLPDPPTAPDSVCVTMPGQVPPASYGGGTGGTAGGGAGGTAGGGTGRGADGPAGGGVESTAAGGAGRSTGSGGSLVGVFSEKTLMSNSSINLKKVWDPSAAEIRQRMRCAGSKVLAI
jgi:hypothetical protein